MAMTSMLSIYKHGNFSHLKEPSDNMNVALVSCRNQLLDNRYRTFNVDIWLVVSLHPIFTLLCKVCVHIEQGNCQLYIT